MVSFWEAFQPKVCLCTLTIVYSIDNTVGESIASMYNLSSIFTSALCASVNMVLRSYISAMDLPTVGTIYNYGIAIGQSNTVQGGVLYE